MSRKYVPEIKHQMRWVRHKYLGGLSGRYIDPNQSIVTSKNSSFCFLIQYTAGHDYKSLDLDDVREYFEISKKMYLWSFFCLLITHLTSQSVNYKQIYIHPATIYVYTFKIPEMNFAETQQELCSGCSLNFCTTDVLTLISCKIAGEVFLQILNL